MDIERPLFRFSANSRTSGRAEVNKLDFAVHVIPKSGQFAARNSNDLRAKTLRP
jgi:hypothetical protein